MRMRHAAVLAGLALGLMSGAANAAILKFDFAPDVYNHDITSFSGTFTDNNIGVITSISGELNGASFNDGGGQYITALSDFTQINFSLSGTEYESSGQANTHDAYRFTVGAIGSGTLAISAVPLPASAPMFGAALMALGAVGYGLKRKGKAAAAA